MIYTIKNNGKEPIKKEFKKKDYSQFMKPINDGTVIVSSQKFHAHLKAQQEITGIEFGQIILTLIKDSKEFRSIKPNAPYSKENKYSTTENNRLPRIKVSKEVNEILIDLRIEGMKRVRAAEYSNERILNDVLLDSQRLQKMQQEAYKEI